MFHYSILPHLIKSFEKIGNTGIVHVATLNWASKHWNTSLPKFSHSTMSASEDDPLYYMNRAHKEELESIPDSWMVRLSFGIITCVVHLVLFFRRFENVLNIMRNTSFVPDLGESFTKFLYTVTLWTVLRG